MLKQMLFEYKLFLIQNFYSSFDLFKWNGKCKMKNAWLLQQLLDIYLIIVDQLFTL